MADQVPINTGGMPAELTGFLLRFEGNQARSEQKIDSLTQVVNQTLSAHGARMDAMSSKVDSHEIAINKNEHSVANLKMVNTALTLKSETQQRDLDAAKAELISVRRDATDAVNDGANQRRELDTVKAQIATATVAGKTSKFFVGGIFGAVVFVLLNIMAGNITIKNFNGDSVKITAQPPTPVPVAPAPSTATRN